MSGIEGTAKGYAAGMIQGRGRHLHREGQEALALWAILKTMMFDCMGLSEPLVPSGHFQYLFEHRSPPPETYVWTTRFEPKRQDGKRLGFYASREIGLESGEDPAETRGREAVNAYLTTFIVNHLVLQTFGHDPHPDAGEVTHQSSIRRALHRIWPVVREPVIWPTGPTLNINDLGALADGPIS